MPGRVTGGRVAAMTTSTSYISAAGQVTIREVEPGDADACARICFDAFGGIHDHHRFPRDFPALEAAAGIMGMWVPHPSIWGVVAEVDGRIAGSNFIDERDPIRAVGPITVDPKGQNAGVGRRLMEAVLERGEGAPGIRLTQDAFNMQSLSLYESLGFDVKEPLAVISGKPASEPCREGRGAARSGRTTSTSARRSARRSMASSARTSFAMPSTRSSRSSPCGTDASRPTHRASCSGL